MMGKNNVGNFAPEHKRGLCYTVMGKAIHAVHVSHSHTIHNTSFKLTAMRNTEETKNLQHWGNTVFLSQSSKWKVK
jgi:hypothetical protein